MKAARLTIPDVIILEPKVFCDTRRFSFERFNAQVFD